MERVVCPKCFKGRVRVHGQVSEVRVVEHWGRKRFKPRPLGIECSCYDCLTTFTHWLDGTTELTPTQQAADALAAAQVQIRNGYDKGPSSEKEGRPAVRQARPALDPRARRSSR